MRFEDHGATLDTSGFYVRDMNAAKVAGDWVSLDHLVTNSGSVLVRVNDTPLSDLATDAYDHHEHDETGGVPASGF